MILLLRNTGNNGAKNCSCSKKYNFVLAENYRAEY